MWQGTNITTTNLVIISDSMDPLRTYVTMILLSSLISSSSPPIRAAWIIHPRSSNFSVITIGICCSSGSFHIARVLPPSLPSPLLDTPMHVLNIKMVRIPMIMKWRSAIIISTGGRIAATQVVELLPPDLHYSGELLWFSELYNNHLPNNSSSSSSMWVASWKFYTSMYG